MGLFQDIREDGSSNAFINLNDSAGNGITSTLVSTKQALDVNVVNAISVGVADQTAYTYGSSTFLPVGGVFQDTSPSLTAGQSGSIRLTSDRAVHMNLRDSSGNELGNSNANGIWAKLGDGTNVGSFSATSEQFVQLRQGGNVATVNGSGQLATADANSAAILALMTASTGTITNPTVTTASTTALVANASRKGFSIYNSTLFPVFLAMAATATSSAFTVKLNPNSYYEDKQNIYTGIITMISPTVTGSPTLSVTEYT